MSGFEWNKIAAAILLAGLIAMIVGTVTEVLYEPELKPEKRGYQVAGVEEDAAKAVGAGKAAPEAPVDIAALMASANVEAGKASTGKCATCHSFDKGGPNKVGPNLWNVLGSLKAHHAGYTYSDAMKGKGGTWGYEDLYHFIHSPKQFVPGTKMGFAGVKKDAENANIIAYLRTLSDKPVPLPTQK